MGISILELVLQRLRGAGFQADSAYPGQKYPKITQPVVAVHIEKVDKNEQTVTLEVNVICPAALGGTACEVTALRATQVLQADGAVCVQNGCTYDGASQVYVVAVLATYTGVAEADSCALGPGFQVYINDIFHPQAVAFSEEESREQEPVYEIGEELPVGILFGGRKWLLTLEEQILPGMAEIPEQEGEFRLRLERGEAAVTFLRCRWYAVRREISRSGVHLVRKALAISREVN